MEINISMINSDTENELNIYTIVTVWIQKKILEYEVCHYNNWKQMTYTHAHTHT